MNGELEPAPVTQILSGDHGWNDADDQPQGAMHSLLLVAATAGYFGSLWLLSGLAPLPMLASRVRSLPLTNWSWRKTAA